MTDAAPTTFLAFPSGAITFDCKSCGRCCRGMGFAASPTQSIPALDAMAIWLNSARSDSALKSYFTFADGCLFLRPDNACRLHAEGGAAAKPVICRLYPFTRLVDADGLLCLLPDARCPWVATSDAAHSLDSDHVALLALLDPLVASGVAPEFLPVLEHLPRRDRARLEVAVREGIEVARPLEENLRRMEDLHVRFLGQIAPPVSPELIELWLDLLRCAGPPAPLPGALERLFHCALSTLRVSLLPYFALRDIPLALRAFALWLRSVQEIGPMALRGDTLLQFLHDAMPLLRALCWASRPVPPAEQFVGRDPYGLVDALCGHAGAPLGLTTLTILRGARVGSVAALRALGGCLPL